MRVRKINSNSTEEVEQVARRMRQTLMEVLGADRGQTMYSIEWLVQRVLWHLDPSQVTGQVFVVENGEGVVVGHSIVRIEKDDNGKDIGLFSTTYVEPTSRRFGVAGRLLDRGEKWMLAQGLTEAATYTDENNIKLQNLYINHGYLMLDMPEHFVKLTKAL